MFQLILQEYNDILKTTSRRLRFLEWAMIVGLAVTMIGSIVSSYFGILWLMIVMLALTLIDIGIIAWNSRKSMKNLDTWRQNTETRAKKLKDALKGNNMDIQKGCDYIIESCDRELKRKKKILPIFTSTAVSIILPIFVVYLNKTTNETTIKLWMPVVVIVVIAYAVLYLALLQLDLTTIKTDRITMLRDDAAYLKAKIPD